MRRGERSLFMATNINTRSRKKLQSRIDYFSTR